METRLLARQRQAAFFIFRCGHTAMEHRVFSRVRMYAAKNEFDRVTARKRAVVYFYSLDSIFLIVGYRSVLVLEKSSIPYCGQNLFSNSNMEGNTK